MKLRLSLEKTFLSPKLYSKSEISMVSMLLTIFFSVFLEEISTFKNKGLTVSRTRVQTLLINNFTYKFCRTTSFFQPLFFYTI